MEPGLASVAGLLSDSQKSERRMRLRCWTQEYGIPRCDPLQVKASERHPRRAGRAARLRRLINRTMEFDARIAATLWGARFSGCRTPGFHPGLFSHAPSGSVCSASHLRPSGSIYSAFHMLLPGASVALLTCSLREHLQRRHSLSLAGKQPRVFRNPHHREHLYEMR